MEKEIIIKSFLHFSPSLSGGNIYNNYVLRLMEEKFEVLNCLNNKSNLKIIPKLFLYNHNTSNALELHGLKSLYFSKEIGRESIALIYHIDNSVLVKGYLRHILYKFLEKNLYRILKNSMIITISKFWNNFFKNRGYENVKLIYCCFDFDKYNRVEHEIEEFKAKYDLLNKKIIYIGNCQAAKGVYRVFQEINNKKYTLITSGQKRCFLPIKNLNLSFYDYINLLHAADVTVAMSLFNEGWCRTAHESMICGTPVIGSGKGGMGELLKGGNQIICKNFSKLSDYIDLVIEDNSYVKTAIDYARKDEFSLKNFNNQWINLIKNNFIK